MNEQHDKMKKISVSIGGISYQLVSQENETYTREIARKVDETIHQIVQQHPSLSTSQATVLAMVNTLDALTKVNSALIEATKEVENVESRAMKEIENAIFKMTKAQHELFSLRDTDFELKKELIRVNELNKQLELEIAFLRKQQSIIPNEMQSDEIYNENENHDEVSDETKIAQNYKTLPKTEFELESELNQENNADNNLENEPKKILEFDIELESEIESEIESDFGIEPELSHELDMYNEIRKQQDIEEMVNEFLGEIQNPFAISNENPPDQMCTEDSFAGYKQPSLEDLFS